MRGESSAERSEEVGTPMVLMEKQLSMSDLEQSEEMIPTGLGANSREVTVNFSPDKVDNMAVD